MKTDPFSGPVDTGLRREKGTAMTTSRNFAAAARTFASDVTQGFLEIIHSSFALIGLAVAFITLACLAHPELRANSETQLRNWLQERHVAVLGFTAEPGAVERATAVNPAELPKQQAAVAYWLSKKYRVAPEPMAALVHAAYEQGKQHRLDPTLILAVAAIESSFNPFAQSAVGAQGLMQVMTRVHTEKYESLGGNFAAFDPVSNMRVGATILKEYIRRAGSVEGGLKWYVGAANMASDGGYAAKVLAEYHRIRQVAGTPVPQQPLLMAAASATTPAAKPAAAAAPTAPATVAEALQAAANAPTAAVAAASVHDAATHVASSSL